jgi:hypothetical protein
MRLIFFILTILPLSFFGQMATFSADTIRFSGEQQSRKDIYDKIMEAEWRIKGQTLRYGSAPIFVRTDNILDTIYYRHRANAKWDTILCNINQPRSLTFRYNECCGGFDVTDSYLCVPLTGAVNFRIKGKPGKRKYLGTLGETGVMVKKSTRKTLRPACRSAMSPNIYPLSFQEIAAGKNEADCPETTCLLVKSPNIMKYEFRYSIISKKLDFLYMPVSNKPLQVIYDPASDQISIE